MFESFLTVTGICAAAYLSDISRRDCEALMTNYRPGKGAHPGFSGPSCRVVQARSYDVAVILVISEYGA